MSNGGKLFLFILLLPLSFAIGFDVYVNFYLNEENLAMIESLQIDPKAVMPSDFGYLIVTYLPDFYENLKLLAGEEIWQKWVDPVLQMYTTLVAAIPLAAYLAWLSLAKIVGIWPFSGNGVIGAAAKMAPKNRGVSDPLDRRSKERFVYKKR